MKHFVKQVPLFPEGDAVITKHEGLTPHKAHKCNRLAALEAQYAKACRENRWQDAEKLKTAIVRAETGGD